MGVPDRSLATSSASAADAYERGRPVYPVDLLDALGRAVGLGPGRDVLDLAAGTGKLTRQLVRFDARLVAVEPLAAMRAQFEVAVPGAAVLDGTAEEIPLDAASIDVVFVAQAYHWFDRDRANREVARVLRPGRHLVCLWNLEDIEVPWVAAVEAVKDDVSGGRRTLVGSAAWDEPSAVPYRTEAVWWRRATAPV